MIARRALYVVGLVFLLLGLVFAAIGSIDPITSVLDEHTSPRSDPVGEVLRAIGLMWAGTAPLLLLLGWLFSLRDRRDRVLQRTGRRVPARVEAVDYTGVVGRSSNAGIRVKLTVQPPNEPEFECEVKTHVPMHAVPQVGDMVLVAYDPGDRGRVTFVAAAGTPPGGGKVLVAPDGTPLNVARSRAAPQSPLDRPAAANGAAPRDSLERLEKLAELRDRGVLTDTEFASQKRKILAES